MIRLRRLPETRNLESYKSMLLRFVDAATTAYVAVLLGMIGLLIVCQLLLQFEPVRHALTRVDRLEGYDLDKMRYGNSNNR